MNACIIGGTGHIGGHLVPMFLRNGIGVTAVVRGRSPVPDEPAWRDVRIVEATYAADDAEWPQRVRDAAVGAEVLIDLLGVDLATTYQAVREVCKQVIACGSIWMLGMPRRVPSPPDAQYAFWGEGYARRWETIQAVLAQSLTGGASFTAILPPNICGPGKIPLDPRGGRSLDVLRGMSNGETVVLPEGADVLLGPCDAEDVAQAFYLAAMKPDAVAGRILNVGSAYALTATEFVATYAEIYGVTIPIRHVPWQDFARDIALDPGARYHFEAHMCPDISATKSLLGYAPQHTPEQSMRRAVEWMRLVKRIEVSQ